MAAAKIPPDHQFHLRRRPFAFRCATDIFPDDELQALTEYGNWLEALANGTIAPVTAEQKRFLRVDREEEEPRTLMERAWVRLKGRREYEKEQHIPPPPPTPAEAYGMIEFDKDRCWW
ncbi:MAG TPA: DUF413 domain-containing protein [Urbifossiella sp.]|jgi:uncharacterized protein YifE (UPF0438 family)